MYNCTLSHCARPIFVQQRFSTSLSSMFNDLIEVTVYMPIYNAGSKMELNSESESLEHEISYLITVLGM